MSAFSLHPPYHQVTPITVPAQLLPTRYAGLRCPPAIPPQMPRHLVKPAVQHGRTSSRRYS
jgi:hypothetical protein